MVHVRLVLAVIGLAAGMLAAIPILVVGLPFWLVAMLTRALLPLCQPTVVQWHELIEFHPILGWKPKPNFGGHCIEERDDMFQVHTGPDGWPGNTAISESKVVVFGDSYAFGYGIDARKAFFGLTPHVPTKAIGAPGYNMVQELLMMEEMAPSLKSKTVLWFVYLGNDLYDNLSPEMTGYRTPFVTQNAQGDWRIVTTHINRSKWSCSVGRQGRHQLYRWHEKLFMRTFLSERAYSACEFLIQRGRGICHKAGAELIVVAIPAPYLLEPPSSIQGKAIDPEYADQNLRAICERLEVHYVALREVLTRSDYKEADHHWNERGHRKVAHTVTKIYRDKAERNTRREERVLARQS